MRECAGCRKDGNPVSLERYGSTATAPEGPAHVRGVVAEREIRFWFRSTLQRRTTITAARYYAGELVSTSELTIPTAERAFKVCLSWSAWLRVKGPPARIG
jgi:hypothetical protein